MLEATLARLVWLKRRWRVVAGTTLYGAAELLLFGAAEGPNKWDAIAAATLPISLLWLGFMLL